MIDRPGRDRLAAALADFLTGRIQSDRFADVRAEFERSPDPSLESLAQSLWFIHDDVSDAPYAGSREDAEALSRYLAFLRSDDELVIEPLLSYSRAGYAALLALFALGIAAVFALGYPAVCIAIPWVATAIPGGIVHAVRERRHRKALERFPYAPYRNRGQWESRKFLIADSPSPMCPSAPGTSIARPWI